MTALPEPEDLERAVGAPLDVGLAGKAQRHRHVLVRRERRPEIVVLEDNPDLARPVFRELDFVKPDQRAAEYPDVARGGLVQAAGEVQHRALAGAGSAEDCDQLPGLDLQLEAP